MCIQANQLGNRLMRKFQVGPTVRLIESRNANFAAELLAPDLILRRSRGPDRLLRAPDRQRKAHTSPKQG
jgi:hypothetical protein